MEHSNQPISGGVGAKALNDEAMQVAHRQTIAEGLQGIVATQKEIQALTVSKQFFDRVAATVMSLMPLTNKLDDDTPGEMMEVIGSSAAVAAEIIGAVLHDRDMRDQVRKPRKGVTTKRGS